MESKYLKDAVKGYDDYLLKHAKEIIDIACSGHAVSVSKVTGKPIACENNS